MFMTEPARPARASRLIIATLIVVVIAVVAVAFWGSWGALRDAALSIHFEPGPASAYPFGVDGLIVIAILTGVVLRHHKAARLYCLGIIAAYSTASLFINILHGLGEFQLDPATGERSVPHPFVVAVIASLVVGTIFLGSHLVVLVGRHCWSEARPVSVPDLPTVVPAVPDAVPPAVIEAAPADEETEDAAEDTPPAVEPPASAYDAAVAAYRFSVQHGPKPLSQQALREKFGVSKREASEVQHAVKAELGLIDPHPDGESGEPGEGTPTLIEFSPTPEPVDDLGDDAVALVAAPPVNGTALALTR